jgi:hypothetical protein
MSLDRDFTLYYVLNHIVVLIISQIFIQAEGNLTVFTIILTSKYVQEVTSWRNHSKCAHNAPARKLSFLLGAHGFRSDIFLSLMSF